jgi:hypothetical protein
VGTALVQRKEKDMRQKEIEIANWLQTMLGEDYIVRYDDCESGFTRVIFKPLNKVTAEVPNSEMHTGISTQEYMASREDRFMAMAIR